MTMTTSLMTPVRLARQLAVFISILASAFPFVLNLFILVWLQKWSGLT